MHATIGPSMMFQGKPINKNNFMEGGGEGTKRLNYVFRPIDQRKSIQYGGKNRNEAF